MNIFYTRTDTEGVTTQLGVDKRLLKHADFKKGIHLEGSHALANFERAELSPNSMYAVVTLKMPDGVRGPYRLLTLEEYTKDLPVDALVSVHADHVWHPALGTPSSYRIYAVPCDKEDNEELEKAKKQVASAKALLKEAEQNLEKVI